MEVLDSLLMSIRVSLVLMLWVVWWGAMEDWKRPMKAPMAPPTTYDMHAFRGQLSPTWICLSVFIHIWICFARDSRLISYCNHPGGVDVLEGGWHHGGGGLGSHG